MVQRRSVEREREWREVIGRHAGSGLSVRAYCTANQVSEACFYAWRRTISLRDAEQRNAGVAVASFVPLLITATPSSSAARLPTDLPPVTSDSTGIVVELRGGRRLRLPEATSTERLVAVLHALEAGEATA